MAKRKAKTVTKEDILLQQLEDCRWQALRELADEAEERGEADLAAGYRWLAENKKWPGQTTSYYWYHYLEETEAEVTYYENYLPVLVREYPLLAPLMRDTARTVGEWLRQEMITEE
jgi:hypothetical protein